MNENITPESIKAILNALVGCTAAQAESHWDAESQANVPKFEAVCDWVYERLCNADKHYDSPYYSAKQTARMVMFAAGDLAHVFNEERERMKNE